MHKRVLRTVASTALSFGFWFLFPITSWAQVFDAESTMLANGMQVVVITNRTAPVVTHMVWYKVGSADDPVGKSGLAHFLEHLMFKGTARVPAGEFSHQVALLGGEENAFTTADYTAYHQSVSVENLETVMRLEADRMNNLTLSEDQVLPERNVILEERRLRVDNDPAAQLDEAIDAALYLNHPYRLPTIGWEHEMRGLTRDDALAFYRRWYVPNNAILIVSGDVMMRDVLPLAERYYGVLPARDVPKRQRLQEPPHRAPVRIVMGSPNAATATWNRRYLAPSYHAGDSRFAYAMDVLNQILGGDSTSRLYRRIVVEEKAASQILTYYDSDRYDLGSFTIAAAAPDGKNTEAIEKLIDAELARLLKDGVTDLEVQTAKGRLKDAAAKARDSLNGPPRTVGAALATGGTLGDIQNWPDRIDAVTRDQVNAAARSILRPETSVTGILQPKKEAP